MTTEASCIKANSLGTYISYRGQEREDALCFKATYPRMLSSQSRLPRGPKSFRTNGLSCSGGSTKQHRILRLLVTCI